MDRFDTIVVLLMIVISTTWAVWMAIYLTLADAPMWLRAIPFIVPLFLGVGALIIERTNL